MFIKTDDHLALWTGTWDNLAVTSVAQLPLVTGPALAASLRPA